MVSNLAAEVREYDGGDFVLPIVVPDSSNRNCYVCSFHSHFGDYARYEIGVRNLGFLGWVLKDCVRGLGGLMRLADSDRAVFVNNWLLSTNLYPPGVESHVKVIRDQVLSQDPRRAIVFRSLNQSSNMALIESLRSFGFQPICTREIYLLDTGDGSHRRRSNVREDLKLLESSGFEIVRGDGFSKSDLGRARELYGKLYLEKYSSLNPQFTQAMFEAGYESSFLNFVGIRSRGELLGVVGYYRCGDWITAPILGYDTDLPQEMGLYRLLTVLLTLEGERLGCQIHRSSGAAAFKLSRGARREVEYSYIYVEHLPRVRRLAWKLFSGIVNRVSSFSLKRIDV